LWATFGVDQLEPYDDNCSREKMKRWKTGELARKAHENLYGPVGSKNENSETYLFLIIKKVFVSEDEQTNKNAIWCQAILEIIFDESNLSSKIDNDNVDKWYSKLTKVFILSVIFCCFVDLLILLIVFRLIIIGK
jgi:hypothetical protein